MVAKYVSRNRESRQTLSRLHDYHEEHSVSLVICVPVIAHATATPAYVVLKVYSLSQMRNGLSAVTVHGWLL